MIQRLLVPEGPQPRQGMQNAPLLMTARGHSSRQAELALPASIAAGPCQELRQLAATRPTRKPQQIQQSKACACSCILVLARTQAWRW